MIRRFLILALALGLEGLAGAQNPTGSKTITDTQALADAFREMVRTHPQFVDNQVRLEGLTIQEVQKQLAETPKRGLLLTTQETIQQVVNGSPGPQPVFGNRIGPAVAPRPTLIAPLTPEESASLSRISSSVARVERLSGPDGAALIGTAFVVGDGEVATNCHVIKQITTGASPGKDLQDPGSLRIDFSDGPNHDVSKEFSVSGVSGCPGVLGLDVGILKVEKLSSDGRNGLPPKLDLIPMMPTPLSGVRVALIGYPGLRNPRDPLYRSLNPSVYAKVLTLGTVLDVIQDPKAPVQHIHHSSNSESGNSGSPLILLAGPTLRVIGIHNCCYDASTALPDDAFPCSFVRGVAHLNSAIASWILRGDPVLGSLLR